MRFEDSFENTQWRKAKSKVGNSRRHEDNYFQFLMNVKVTSDAEADYDEEECNDEDDYNEDGHDV